MSVRRLAPVAIIGLCVVAATACGNGDSPAHDHGKVVALLPIPFAPRLAAGKAEVIRVTVGVGQRFSVKVATSDGPFYWSEVGAAPDPHLVRFAGDFNDGHCAANLVGCRVPFFHTLVARARGTTTMSWRYHSLACRSHDELPGNPGRLCAKTDTVTFDFKVR